MRALALWIGVLALGCGRSGYEIDGRDAAWSDEDPADPADPADPIVDRCDAVDYLFVIDDSASMADNQRKLIDNFGAFIEEVEGSLDTIGSFHLGVTTTDAYVHNVDACRGLGGLVVQTGGYNSSGRECGPYADGHNYMTASDDLDAAFGCAAQVGTMGSTFEQPLSAAAHAIDGPLTDAGECNDGFVRDDALLVVVVVTDEDEPGAAPVLSEALTNAKLGFRDNAVLVAIVNRPGEGCGLGGHATAADEVIALAEGIEHGFVGSICDEDYSVIFGEAVDVVRRACGQ